MSSLRFVLRTDPIPMATKVPLDAVIQIYFMIDLKTSCVTESNFILLNLDTQSGEPVSLDYKNKVLTMTPLQPLQPNSHYQVELVGGPEGLVNIVEGTMDASYVFEFYSETIHQIMPPSFTVPTEFTDISLLRFAWDAVKDATHYEMEISKSKTFNHVLWPLKNIRIQETSIVLDAALEEGTYYAHIRSVNDEGTKSAFSDPLQFSYKPMVIQDTSQGSTDSQLSLIQDALTGSTDTSDPYLTIVSTNPTDGSINVPISYDIVTNPLTEVMVEFDEEIDPNTLRATNFYIIAQKN